MNRRDAKREAFGRAADCLFDALNAGWDELEQIYGGDAEKVRAGINEIVGEMQRRGGSADA